MWPVSTETDLTGSDDTGSKGEISLQQVMNTNSGWLKKVETLQKKLTSKIDKLCRSKKTYFECRDDVSDIRNELKDSEIEAKTILKDLERATYDDKYSGARQKWLDRANSLLKTIEYANYKLEKFQESLHL